MVNLTVECVMPSGSRQFVKETPKGWELTKDRSQISYPDKSTELIKFLERESGQITGTQICYLDGNRPVKYCTNNLRWVLFF